MCTIEEQLAPLKDHLAWLSRRCKDLKTEVDEAQRLLREFGMFEDCGDSYDHGLTAAKAKLEEAVRIKVSTEKFIKKLKHQHREGGADEQAG